MRGKPNKSGFTVIELMIVLAIMVIIAATAVPYMMAGMTGGGLAQAAEQLRSDFHRAKMLAISRQASCTIQLDTGNHTYTISLNNQTIDLSDYGGDIQIGAGSVSVTFTPQGICSTAGSVFLRDVHPRGSTELWEVRVSLAGGISKRADGVKAKS